MPLGNIQYPSTLNMVSMRSLKSGNEFISNGGECEWLLLATQIFAPSSYLAVGLFDSRSVIAISRSCNSSLPRYDPLSIWLVAIGCGKPETRPYACPILRFPGFCVIILLV